MPSRERPTDHQCISLFPTVVHLIVLVGALEVVVVSGGRAMLHLAAIDVTAFAVVVSATVDGSARGADAHVSVIDILRGRVRNCSLASS